MTTMTGMACDVASEVQIDDARAIIAPIVESASEVNDSSGMRQCDSLQGARSVSSPAESSTRAAARRTKNSE